MSAFGDALAGLKRVLEDNVSGLKAFDYPVSAFAHYPAAVILPEPLDMEVALQGNTFTGRFRVLFAVASGDVAEGFLQLYDYIDPTVAQKSVVKAVRTDRTLNGKVDDADVVRIENIGRRQMGDGFVYGFDAVVEFIKSVA